MPETLAPSPPWRTSGPPKELSPVLYLLYPFSVKYFGEMMSNEGKIFGSLLLFSCHHIVIRYMRYGVAYLLHMSVHTFDFDSYTYTHPSPQTVRHHHVTSKGALAI